MKTKLFLIFLFIFFISNAVFAEVSITESDAQLLWEQEGYSYEDINNTADHYRSLGLTDKEIQKKLDKKIKEIKAEKNKNNNSDTESAEFMPKPILIFFSVLGLIFLIAMFYSAKQESREWYKKYSELDERYRKLLKDYSELHDEKLKNEIENSGEDNSYKPEEEHKRQCQICKSTENVHYYPTDGYEETDGNKKFYSGGFYMCDKCLSACEKCECGKLKIPFFLEKFIGGLMNHPNFCKCPEAPELKKERNRREFNIYEQNCKDAGK